MIAVDTNILVYAFNERARLHQQAVAVVRGLAEGDAAWAIPVFVVGEFIRVVTHRRGPMSRPVDGGRALRSIDGLLGSPSARVLFPGRRYLPLFRGLIADTAPRGNDIFDAQIAAVCLEHGATTVLTNNARFRLFSGITVRGVG